jgi:tetratricopeptide (TPR) repeat protein
MSAENDRYCLEDANSLFSAGDDALGHSRHEEAKDAFKRTLVIYRRVESALGQANCIRRLADIAVRQGRYEAATEAYGRANRLYDLGNTHGEANCCKGLADLALLSGNLSGAQEKYEQAHKAFQAVGDNLGVANCLKRVIRHRISCFRSRRRPGRISEGASPLSGAEKPAWRGGRLRGSRRCCPGRRRI